jgi:hypothetical protein
VILVAAFVCVCWAYSEARGTGSPFATMSGSTSIAETWYGPGGPGGDRGGGLSLGARRALLNRLLTITINPNPKLRPPPAGRGTYLDRDSIDVYWK